MRWKNDELQFLIDNSDKMTIDEIAKKLNRTNGSVYKKCLKLKINYINSGNICTDWTDDQINFLKENYKTLSNAFLQESISLLVTSIIHHCPSTQTLFHSCPPPCK